LTNTGTVTWNNTGVNPVRLGVYFNGTSDAIGAWPTEPRRYSLPASIPPGGSVTISINITTPTAAGSYVLRHRMVKEGIQWSNDLFKTK